VAVRRAEQAAESQLLDWYRGQEELEDLPVASRKTLLERFVEESELEMADFDWRYIDYDDRDRWDWWDEDRAWDDHRDDDRREFEYAANGFTKDEWLRGEPCRDLYPLTFVWNPSLDYWGDEDAPELFEENWSVELHFRFVDKHTPRWCSYEVRADTEAEAITQARRLAKRDGYLVRGTTFKVWPL
jgi:hypothetical protein